MNKEYTYIDGKVILKDNLDNIKKIEYCDNLEEILIQENLIETIQNKIDKLEEDSNKYKKNKKKYIPLMFIIGELISLITPTIMLYMMGGIPAISCIIETAYGPLNISLVLTCLTNIITIPTFIGIETTYYSSYKEEEKNKMSIDSELEFLKKQINIEENKLSKLNKDIKKNNLKPGLEIKKINDSKVIEVLESKAKLYRDCGYNGKKYYKYLQKGILEKKLINKYTVDQIQKIEEYLEEKGPQLIKK